MSKTSFVKLLIFFLFINFAGLYLGGYLMNEGPTSLWYESLNKAPWTPPGWIFGVAWTFIMICYSIYLAKFFQGHGHGAKEKGLIACTVLLNVLWNYVFFSQHYIGLGLLVLTLLLVVLVFMFIQYKQENLKVIRYWLAPYILWMLVAFSLNAYILLYN